jgi:hypothetical protein
MLGFGKPASIAAGVFIGGAGIKGFFDQVAPKTIDNAMDIAFGDPQADRAVLGTDLTPSMMYMASGLPGSSSIGRNMNLGRVGLNTAGPLSVNTAKIAGVGGLIGAVAGAKASGLKGAVIGGALGAIGGATAGATGSVASAVRVARNNRQIMTESPFYNQSLLTAERLNASGNIVLRNA